MASYVLLIDVSCTCDITIGAVGERHLEQGHYLYVGSARRAWQKRVARHLSQEKKKRWHVDYLLMTPGVSIPTVWINARDCECETAQRLLDLPVVEPLNGIGASDCKCPAHLLHYSGDFKHLHTLLQQQGFSRHTPVEIRALA